MSIPSRQDFAPYVRKVADLMRLRDWDFVIKDESPCDDDALASVVCWPMRHMATIRFSDNFLAETPEEQRFCVVHELVHCLNAMPDQLARKEFGRHALEAWVQAMEYAVDSLASVISANMPLPEFD